MTRLEILSDLVSASTAAQGRVSLTDNEIHGLLLLAERVITLERQRPPLNIARAARVPDPTGAPLPQVELEDEACDSFDGELYHPERCASCAHPIGAHDFDAVSPMDLARALHFGKPAP